MVRRSLKAQSEFLSTIILLTLTVIIGTIGFYMTGSFMTAKMSDAAFQSFAEQASNEFVVTVASIENYSTNTTVTAVIYRIGVIRDPLWVGLSLFSTPVVGQNLSWWKSQQLVPGVNTSILYNISLIPSGDYNVSFTGISGGNLIRSSSLYARYGGIWWRISDLGGPQSIYVSGVGVFDKNYVAIIRFSVPTDTSYVYLVIWVLSGGRLISIPKPLTIR